MTNIAPAAAAARENARTTGGQFGEQQHSEAPAGVITYGPLTDDQRRQYGDIYDGIAKARKAMAGDSNDAEYDALVELDDSVVQHLGTLLEAGHGNSDWYKALEGAHEDAEAAFDAESNDAEHDGLVEVESTLTNYLTAKGVPLPEDGDDDDDED